MKISAQTNIPDAHESLDDAFITSIYESMLAFAKTQLKSDALAQEVVQEALTSALQHASSFSGRSTLKTWVFAILKNKIIDALRKEKKYVGVEDLAVKNNDRQNNQTSEDFLDLLFDDAGFWYSHTKPQAFDNSWQNPEQPIHTQDFFDILEVCLTNVPPEQAQVFFMREYIELSTEEICENLNITSNKYYVLMHRSRLRLQECLRAKWFEEQQ